MRLSKDSPICADCGCGAKSEFRTGGPAVVVKDTGEILCPRCAYKRLHEAAVLDRDIGERILKNRRDTMGLAASRTKLGRTCPEDCAMYSDRGCAVLKETYERGACPFYRPVLPAEEDEWD